MHITVREVNREKARSILKVIYDVNGKMFTLSNVPGIRNIHSLNFEEIVNQTYYLISLNQYESFLEYNKVHFKLPWRIAGELFFEELVCFALSAFKMIPTHDKPLDSNEIVRELFQVKVGLNAIAFQSRLGAILKEKSLDEHVNCLREAFKLGDIETAILYSRKLQYSKEITKALSLIDDADKEYFFTHVARSMISGGTMPSPMKIFKKIFIGKQPTYFGLKEIIKRVSDKIEDEYIARQMNHSYSFSDDVWILRRLDGTKTIKETRLNYFAYESPLKELIKKFIQDNLVHGNHHVTLLNKLNNIYRFVTEFRKLKYNLLPNILEIKDVPHLRELKLTMEQKYKLAVVKQAFSTMREFYDWVAIESKVKVAGNPFNKISFRNLNNYIDHHEDIPDEVIEVIEESFGKLREDYQNGWIILMNSGMRSSELVNLESDWLYYSQQNEQYELKYIPLKNEKRRVAKGNSKFHIIPANEKLVKAFKDQLVLTEDLRKQYGTKKLFIHRNIGKLGVTTFSARSIQKAINKLLKKAYETKRLNTLFHFTPHMCRKTVIVNLLSEGQDIRGVADFIGHDSTQATEESYKGIQTKKMLELEQNFFDQAFDYLFKPKMASLPAEDLEAIRKEVKLGSRISPEGQGYCGKHVSFGPCVKNKCVGCRLLITTPYQIPKFREMIHEQKRYITMLQEQFDKLGIPKEEYESYRDYNSELYHLVQLEDTLQQLIRFVKEKLPTHEHYKYLED